MATKKTQKLFGDFASKVSGVPGMVTPSITSDITQKSEEDDPSTIAGYKKRLQLQRGEEESAYQSKMAYQRNLQLQWEQEDMKRAADQMRMLDKQRKEAFDLIYRPQVESAQVMQNQNRSTQAGLMNPQIMNTLAPHQGELIDPASGGRVIPGQKGITGGQWHTSYTGAVLPGPDPNQAQQVLNRNYAQSATAQQGQNTNPYYRNPYA